MPSSRFSTRIRSIGAVATNSTVGSGLSVILRENTMLRRCWEAFVIPSRTPSVELLTELMRALFNHISDDRTGWLALLELRLEATRRPELQAALTETLRANLNANIEGRRESGIPGDDMTTVLLYYAMTGLIVEHLTVLEVLAPFNVDDLIATFVNRSLAP